MAVWPFRVPSVVHGTKARDHALPARRLDSAPRQRISLSIHTTLGGAPDVALGTARRLLAPINERLETWRQTLASDEREAATSTWPALSLSPGQSSSPPRSTYAPGVPRESSRLASGRADALWTGQDDRQREQTRAARQLRDTLRPARAASSGLERQTGVPAQRPTRAGNRPPALRLARRSGGGEIRTLGTPIRRTTVFETAAFNRSATPPDDGCRVKDRISRGAPPARDRERSGWMWR